MVPLALTAVLAFLAGPTLSQELCAVNQCNNGENCYNRPNSAEGYVCECNLPFRDGYNCEIGPDNQEVFTCYGSSCISGTFTSINYPNTYPNRYRALYLLYIPGANGIMFTFNDPFGIETNKDELYIGKGLSVDFSVLQGTSTVGPDMFFFDGFEVPATATIMNTDTAFLYFITDKNLEYSGFSVQFQMVDNEPPVISNCPNDISLTTTSTQGTQAFWTPPTATDADVFTTSSTHTPGQVFPLGPTQVTYTFRDTQGNEATCSFTVTVTRIDVEPPTITTTSEDITVTVPFGSTGTNVNWVEPTATDNFGTVFTSRTHIPGSFFSTGTTTEVTYSFTDLAGNIARTTFRVTVVEEADGTPPVVTSFPNDITVTVPFGSTGTPVSWTEPTAVDNSGSVFQNPSIPSGSTFPVGTTPVTYTFTDPNGNLVTQTFNVNVIMLPDTEQPQVTSFPDDITVTVPFGTTNTPVSWPTPTATDNSGTVNTNTDRQPGSSFPPGTTPVTYTFTDPNGNEVQQTFNVNVIVLPDDTPPVVTTFPNDITVTVPFGSTGTPVTWTEPTAVDNSGSVFQNPSIPPGTTFPVGTTPVTYTFTDPTGNIVTQSFNVNVIMLADTEPPQVTSFPDDVTVTVPFGTTDTPVSWPTPTATDNSGTVNTNTNRQPGSSFPPGTTPVTYTFTDPNGNEVTETFNVNVIVLPDSTPPVITSFPSDVTVTVPFGTPSSPVTWTEPTSADNSGTSFQTPSIPSGSDFPVGTTPVTYTFTDPTGNIITQSFNVNVIMLADTEPPQVTSFPDDVTVTVPFGTTDTPVSWPTPTATDNSGTVNTNTNRQPGSSFPPGTTPVTYTFTDPNGNEVTETFNVNVIVLPDSTPPVITSFPSDVTVTVPFGTPSSPVTWTEPTSTDNSGTSFQTPSIPSGSDFPVGTTPVTYTFTDPTGNEVQQTFNVNVIELPDDTPPVVTSFPNDITVTVPFGSTGTPVTWTDPTAVDDSGTVFQNPSIPPGTTFPVGTTPVTYTFTDPTGNIVTQTFDVNVIMLPDSEQPQITSFPDDVTVTVPFGTTSTPVSWPTPTATDNSGTVNTNTDRQPGSSFPPGTTPVTYTFTDPTGNEVQQTFNVNVIVLPDDTPPVVTTFPNDITVTVPFGSTGTPVTWTEPTAVDNSGTVFQNPTTPSGTTFPVGTTPVTYTFTDPTGNIVTQSFNVNVIELPDTEQPQITSFPDDITVTVPFGTTNTPVSWPTPTATDNSGTVNTNTDRQPGSSFPPGTTPVTYTFTDPNGNEVQQTFNVNVIVLPDATPPVVTSFPSDITVTVPFGTPSTPVTWTEPTSTDNSGTSFQSPSIPSGSDFPVGTTPVTYTFTDPTGNEIRQTFNVNVIELPDVTPPVVTSFPNDITVTVPFGTQSTPVSWTEPTSTDNSGTSLQTPSIPSGSDFPVGTTPVTYTFTDPNGNFITETFNVNVIMLSDTEPPQVTSFPDDITVTVPFGTTSTPVSWPTPTVTDNSGTVNTNTDRQPGSSFPPGTTPVTYTFIDPSGNEVTSTFNVNVIVLPDGTPPVVTTFPNDITVTVPFGTQSTPVSWNEPTSTDNSGTSFQTPSIPSGSDFPVGTTPVTYTFTDPTGNFVTQSFNVNVIMLPDTEQPLITSFPNDITVTVPFGTTSTPVSWPTPTATDNSGTVNTNTDRQPGSSFPVGTTPVTYTFTDPAGNEVRRTFNVNVIVLSDDQPPVITSFPDDITVTVPFGTQSTPVTWTEPTSTDNSGTSFQNPSIPSGSDFPVGTTPVTYTFIDPTGNLVTRSFTVNVIMLPDTERPVVTSFPEDITVTVPFGTTSTPVTWPSPTATDNSGTVNTNTDRQPGSSFPPGTTPVTYSFTDPAGNIVTQSFDVNVIVLPDATPPVITSFPNDITVTVPFGTPSTPVSWTEPTSTDNSGTSFQTPSIPSGSDFPVGSTPVTYTFTDPTGNEVQQTFNVNVIELADELPPVVTSFPSDITVTVPFGTPSTPVTWTEPTSTDNSGTSFQNPSIPSGSDFPVGTTPVTYTFTDPNGNLVTRTFSVNVVMLPDTERPEVTSFPEDITVTVPFGTTSTPVTWPFPTATDNSGTVNTNTDRQPGSSFPPGSTPVTYTFTDPSGNEVRRTFSVNVIVLPDDQPPVVTSFPDDITVTVPFGSTGTPVTWTEPTSVDNSGTVFQNPSIAPGTTFPVGTTPVTYTFTDPTGNMVTRTLNVNVIELPDTEDPEVTSFPEDITVTVPFGTTSTPIAWPSPTATDNSGTVNTNTDRQPGSSFPPGTTPVTYTFTDPSGNEVTRTFNVNVQVLPDNMPPLVTSFPSDITVTVPFGTPSTPVNWEEPTSTDNSGTSFQNPSIPSGSDFPVGTTPVTYTFIDPTGNEVTQTFNVNVIELPDSIMPTIINAPENIEVLVPFGSTGTNVNWTPPTATDNSGTVTPSSNRDPGSFFPTGTTTPVTYTFTDPAGNQARTTFTVTVTELPDDIPPMITTMSEDITVTVPFQSPGTTVDWTEPTATDNSGFYTTTKSAEPGSFFPTGSVTPVTYTFTDAAGNTVRTTFTVRVVEEGDMVSPMLITCQEDITYTVLTGMAPVPVTFTAPSASDNSGQVNLVLFTKSPGELFNVGQTTVEYRFQDQAGNTVSCIFVVEIIEANPCLPEPCQNGAACVPLTLTTHRCICPDCFTGDNCEIPVDACDGNLCQNGAACSSLAGSCTQYECQCPACYVGQFCQLYVDSCENNQCANGAVCVTSPDNCIEYTCQCPPCFTGRYCDIPIGACDNHACQNGGVCVPSSTNPNSAFSCTEYTCSCTSCFTGTRCELERDACNPNPCVNNGICSTLPDSCTSYSCQCVGCFTGYNCELVIPSPCQNNPCQNGGVCSEVQGTCAAYTCACPNGFIGINCETPTTANPNPCNSFPCQNGASCLTMDADHYICLCTSDYVGPNCLTPKANSPQLDPCANFPCTNGGQCYNSYNSNSGTNTALVQYSCVCASGFTGINCNTPTGDDPSLDICSLGERPPCRQGATCSNAYHSLDGDIDYHCDCPVGFIGHNCETSVNDPCSSNPCKNGAVCVAINAFFMCECQDGFGGKTCESRVGDTIPPVIENCPESIYVNAGGQPSQTVTWTPPTATDNSNAVFQVFASHQPNSQFNAGVTPVTYVFADQSQNYARCTFFVTVDDAAPVSDTTPPTITNCPNDITVTAAQGATSAVVTWSEPTVTDDSGGAVNRQVTAESGSSFNIGPTQVIYTFTDPSGNPANCIFTVTVIPSTPSDTTPPVISNCPMGASATAATGATSAQVIWPVPTAVDESGGQVMVESTHQPGDSFQIGVTTVTYTFTDPSGNSDTCSFVVMVNSMSMPDTTAPVITGCPSNQIVGPDPGSSLATVSWVEPTATDDSGSAPNLARSHTPPATFQVNTVTRVSYVFYDNFGNFDTCSFTVTVRAGTVPSDTTPPVINNCPNDITVSAPVGASSAIVSWTEPTAVDNDGQVPNLVRSHAPSTAFNLGPTTVTYIFTDQSGNENRCSFTVTVVSQGGGDTTDPVFTDCPDNVVSYVNGPSATASVGWSVPSAVDNSGIAPTVTGSLNPPVNLGVGTTTATYTARDAAGNEATCTFTVSVILDEQEPVFANCPSDRTETLIPGNSNVASTWVEPTATDNAGPVTTVKSHSPGDLFTLGQTTVTYTFRDSAGNEAVCSFIVTVATGGTPNPCSSSPCPSGQDCYYRPDPPEYLCLTPRNRRDVMEDGCLCKNGGECVNDDDGFTCACPANFTGVLCEVHVSTPIKGSPKEKVPKDLETYHVHESDYGQWMMGAMVAVLGVVVIVLAVTVCRLTPRSATRSDSIDKASLVY